MKTRLMMVALVALMPLSAPAEAFNLIRYLFVEPAEEAVEEEVKKAILGTITNPAAVQKNGKAKAKPKPPPMLVAGTVEESDHRRLPLTGPLRFPLPKGMDLAALEIGPNGGYIDRFGSEWIPYRANGRLVAWRCNLSERGQLRLASVSGGQRFVLVGRDGKKITVAAS